MGGEKNSSLVCVYSFVSVFVCWTLTYWLAAAAAGRQASKQSLKEGSSACLLACEAVAFNWKISNSVAPTVKMARLRNLGCGKKRWVQ